MSACSVEDFNAKSTANELSQNYKTMMGGGHDAKEAAQALSDSLGYVNDSHICGIEPSKLVEDVFKDLSGPLASAAQIKYVDKPGYPHLDETHQEPQIVIPNLNWTKFMKND